MLENLLLSIEAFSLILIVILLIIYWKMSESNSFLKGYTFYTVSMFIYIVSHMLKQVNEPLSLQTYYLDYIKSIAYIFSQLTWPVLCWIFLNNRKPFNRKILAIYILPTIFALLLLTNGWHGVMGSVEQIASDKVLYRSYLREAFPIVIFISVIPFGIIILKKLFSQKGYLFRQGSVIICFAIMPTVFYGFRVLLGGDLLPTSDLDPVPFVSSVSTVFFGTAALRYRLLDLVPIAFKEFVQNINTPFLILDNQHKVIYFNTALKNTFHLQYNIPQKQHIDLFLEKLSKHTPGLDKIEDLKELVYSEGIVTTNLELSISIPSKKFYNISVQPIIAFGNELIGKVISFRDITDYKNLAIVEARLSASKVRNAICQDAHDIIGNAMTQIIWCLREDLDGLTEEELKSRSKAVSALKTAEEKSAEFRELLYKNYEDGTKSTQVQAVNFAGKLLSNLSTAKIRLPNNIKLNIQIDETVVISNEKLFKAVYMICLEAINNSIKHGQAKNIDIILKQNDKFLRLNIIDDGNGCSVVTKGIGLTGMEERAQSLGGTMRYSCEKGKEFRICIKIPVVV